MAEKTVREQLAEALTTLLAESRGERIEGDWGESIDIATRALTRARAEPEECICDTCPVCAVSVRNCQCYQEGTEAQREPAGRGMA